MPHRLLQRYIEPLLRGDRKSCRDIVHGAVQTGAPPAAVMQKLIWPAMETVDRLYREDQINIAAEHMATRINRVLADQLQVHLPKGNPNGRRLLIVCADDEPEELGAQMCADLFEADGWDVYFLGGGVPHDEISAMVGQLRPDLMIVFGSKPSDAPKCRELVTMIRSIGANPTMNIMVSGGVFNRADGLWKEVQADLFAPSAGDALKIANEARPRTPDPHVVIGSVKKRRRRRRPPLLENAMAHA